MDELERLRRRVREAREEIANDLHNHVWVADHPRGYGPGAFRAYANRAIGLKMALDTLDRAMDTEAFHG